MTLTTSSKVEHFPALDGIRGIAAVLVALAHYSQATKIGSFFQPGATGVMIFFVLSGFLMGELYLNRAFNTQSVYDFSVKRFARIIPLYYFIVIISFIITVSNFSWVRMYDINTKNIFEHLFFVDGVLSLWTVPPEIKFYCMFPVIWWIFLKMPRTLSILALFSSVIILCKFFPYGDNKFLGSVPFFLGGTLAATLRSRENYKNDGLFLMALALTVLMYPGMRYIFGYPNVLAKGSPIPILIISLLIMSACMSNIANYVFGNRLFSFLGKVSFSFYLWHFPVMWMGQSLGILKSNYPSFAVLVILTAAVSWISYSCIERVSQRYILRALLPKRGGNIVIPGKTAPQSANG